MSLNRASFGQQHGLFPQYPQSDSTQSQESSWIDFIFGFGQQQQQQQYIVPPLASKLSFATASTSSSYGHEGQGHYDSSSSTSRPQHLVPRFPRYGILSRVMVLYTRDTFMTIRHGIVPLSRSSNIVGQQKSSFKINSNRNNSINNIVRWITMMIFSHPETLWY